MLSIGKMSQEPRSYDSLPNSKHYGTKIVLGSNVNAPERLASPWSNCGEVQRGQSKRGSVQDGYQTIIELWYSYRTGVVKEQ